VCETIGQVKFEASLIALTHLNSIVTVTYNSACLKFSCKQKKGNIYSSLRNENLNLPVQIKFLNLFLQIS